MLHLKSFIRWMSLVGLVLMLAAPASAQNWRRYRAYNSYGGYPYSYNASPYYGNYYGGYNPYYSNNGYNPYYGGYYRRRNRSILPYVIGGAILYGALR